MKIESQLGIDFTNGQWTKPDILMKFTKITGSAGFGQNLRRGECGWALRAMTTEPGMIRWVSSNQVMIKIIQENGLPQKWIFQTPFDEWQTQDKIVTFKATYAGRGNVEAPAGQNFRYADPPRP